MELNGSGQPARPAEAASVRTDPRDDGGALRARMEVGGGAGGAASWLRPLVRGLDREVNCQKTRIHLAGIQTKKGP